METSFAEEPVPEAPLLKSQPAFVIPHVLSGLETVKVDGLAQILGRTPATIKTQLCRSPERLPPHFPGSWPKIWRLVTVLEWMDKIEGRARQKTQLETPQAPIKRKPGRPRNVG